MMNAFSPSGENAAAVAPEMFNGVGVEDAPAVLTTKT
jgi:hypothetical protein